MRIRELYNQFLTPTDRRVAGQYEAALRVWERLTSDPPVGQVTVDCVEEFRQRCNAEPKMIGQKEDCWRYLRSIMIAAHRRGVLIPCIHRPG